MGVKHRVKRAYTLLLISYLALLILPAGFTVFLVREVYQTSEKRCVERALVELARAGATLQKQLENMDAAVMPLSYDSDMAQMMSLARPSGGETSVYQILRFSRMLDDKFKSMDSENTGYRVFLENNEFVFYNGYVSYGFDFYCQYALKYDNMDTDEWRKRVFAADERELIPMDSITFVSNLNLDAITYNYPLKRRAANGEIRRAAVQFFISRNTLEDLFSFIGDDGQACIYARNGEKTASVGRARGYEPDLSAMTGGSGFFYADDDNDILTYYRPSEDMLLLTAQDTRVAISDAIAVRRLSMIALSVYAVVEALLCVYLARRNAMPIRKFVTSVRDYLPDNDENISDYAYLDKSISHFERSQRRIDAALMEKRTLEETIRLERLADLILEGGNSNIESAIALSDKIGVSIQADMYCVATLSHCGNADEIVNLARALKRDGFRVIFNRYRDGCVAFIFFFDTKNARENRDSAVGYLRGLIDGIENAPHGGLGKLYDDISDVPTSCQQSLYCAKLGDTKNDIDLFDNVSRAFNAPHFSLKQQQRLQNAVRHHDEDAVRQIFARISVENTQDRHLSSTLQSVLISTIEAALLMAAEEVAAVENLSDLLHLVRRSDDFGSRLSALEDAFISVCRARAERAGGHKEEMRDELLKYIDDNYADESVCVAGAAACFNLSESYFSTLFKELTGEAFSQRLESVRLQRATEMLTDTDLSVEEIARRVGYSSDSSFRRAYKRVLGVTPAQAREG